VCPLKPVSNLSNLPQPVPLAAYVFPLLRPLRPPAVEDVDIVGGGCPLPPPPPAAAAVVDEVMMRKQTQTGSMVEGGHKYNLRN
jgi:hypothetical protein